MIIEVENMMNSHWSTSPEEDGPITPNHFLLEGFSYAATPHGLNLLPTRGAWNQRKEILDAAWKVWINLPAKPDDAREVEGRTKGAADRCVLQ